MTAEYDTDSQVTAGYDSDAPISLPRPQDDLTAEAIRSAMPLEGSHTDGCCRSHSLDDCNAGHWSFKCSGAQQATRLCRPCCDSPVTPTAIASGKDTASRTGSQCRSSRMPLWPCCETAHGDQAFIADPSSQARIKEAEVAR